MMSPSRLRMPFVAFPLLTRNKVGPFFVIPPRKAQSLRSLKLCGTPVAGLTRNPQLSNKLVILYLWGGLSYY
jgi:hypothetical protein